MRRLIYDEVDRVMIIVSGRIYVVPGSREMFLEKSMDAIRSARATPGCPDFVVAADPLEPDRVDVYEEWHSESELHAFRGPGPGSGITSLIESAHVAEYRVSPDNT